MISLLLLVIIISALGLSAAWLGNHPGNVSMNWLGYEIETSAAVLGALMLIVAITVSITYVFLRNILLAPSRIKTRRSLKQYKLGLAEITQSVAMLAANDLKNAQAHTKRAERHLGETPLTLLLRAQISKTEGSDSQTKVLLEKLLEHPETEYLAAKSLSDAEAKQQHAPQALALAKRAYQVNPKLPQSAWSVFDLHLNAGELQEAEAHAIAARKQKTFSASDLALANGKIAHKQAVNANQAGNKDAAIRSIEVAIKAMPHDANTGLLAAQLYSETNQHHKALALIKSQWKYVPSKALAAIFNDIIDDEKPAKQDKLKAKLQARNPTAAENTFL